MTTASYDTSGGGTGVAVIILAILLGLFAWAGYQVVSNLDMDGDLPLTQHAQQSHAEQTWNAASIQEYMKTSGCTPREYLCPNGVRVKFCEIKDGLSVGLFIGEQVRQVISGFAARTSYWESRGCP